MPIALVGVLASLPALALAQPASPIATGQGPGAGLSGLFALLALYHLLQWFRRRAAADGWFLLFCLGGLGLTILAAGPSDALVVSVGLGLCACHCCFARVVLEGGRHAPWLVRPLEQLAIVQAALASVAPWLSVTVRWNLLLAGAAATAVACVLLGGCALRRRFFASELYLAGWLAGLGGIAVSVHAWQTGTVSELPWRDPRGLAFQTLCFALLLARRSARGSLEAEVLAHDETGPIGEESRGGAANEKVRREAELAICELEIEQREALRARTEAEEARKEAEFARKMAEDAQFEIEAARLDAEAARVRAETLDEQKTHFFQTISHELRTPLTLLLNPLEAAAHDHADDERLSLAERNARRLLRLVNQLLEFQKMSAGKALLELTSIDVLRFAWACGDYVRNFCGGKGIAFRVMLDREEVIDPEAQAGRYLIRAEVDGLEKVIFNYLSNALKFTPEGGEIRIELEAQGGSLRVAVSDTGPGIELEDQEKLFQLFSQVDGGSTRDVEGTGLGLAFVKELTEAMGGTVGVDSNPGFGSRFWACFSRVQEGESDAQPTDLAGFEVKPWLLDHPGLGEDEEEQEDEQAREDDGDGYHILVVDDLSDMRRLIAGVLRRQGYRVSPAADAFEALEKLPSLRPDLVITDWMMPGKSGLDLIVEMRDQESVARVPIVLLTARSDEEGKLLGTEVGADAFLGKPFNDQELCATVRNLLALKQQEREVEALNRQLQEGVLKRYLPADLVDAIVSGEEGLGAKPDNRALTVLFADLCDFTGTTESLRASKMAELLNEYLAEMTRVVFEHGGTVDKFVGDAVMVIFGAPSRMEAVEQVRRAAACGLAMQVAMNRLGQVWKQRGLPALELRVGLHHGPAVVGNFGSEQRMDYTAIGHTVNLASRIEGFCKPGEIFASPEVVDYLPAEACEEVGEFEFKGIKHPLTLFRLLPSGAKAIKDAA